MCDGSSFSRCQVVSAILEHTTQIRHLKLRWTSNTLAPAMSTDVKDATRAETKTSLANVQAAARLATAQASTMPQLRLPDAHALLVYLPSSEKYASWRLSVRGKAEFSTSVVAISYQVVPPAPYNQVALALVLAGKEGKLAPDEASQVTASRIIVLPFQGACRLPPPSSAHLA